MVNLDMKKNERTETLFCSRGTFYFDCNKINERKGISGAAVARIVVKKEVF